MIKRIKRKYAIIIMTSVIIVLGLIITAINVTNYSSIGSLLDDKLTMLVENDGLIPEVNFGAPPVPPESGESDGSSDTDQEDTDADAPTDNDGDVPGEGNTENGDTVGDTAGDTDTGNGEGTGNTDKDEENKKEENKKEK